MGDRRRGRNKQKNLRNGTEISMSGTREINKTIFIFNLRFFYLLTKAANLFSLDRFNKQKACRFYEKITVIDFLPPGLLNLCFRYAFNEIKDE